MRDKRLPMKLVDENDEMKNPKFQLQQMIGKNDRLKLPSGAATVDTTADINWRRLDTTVDIN